MHLPHLPEEIKPFGKHLFATFLGLLMALGLESWHQEHQAKARALSQMEQVEKELRHNDAMLARLQKDLGQVVQVQQTAIDAVRDFQRTHQLGPRCGSLDTAQFNFATSAWEAAVNLGVQRYLTPAKGSALSTLYTSMKRNQGIQDALVLYVPHDRARKLWTSDWTQLTPMELRDLEIGVRGFVQLNGERLRFVEGFRANIQEVLHAH